MHTRTMPRCGIAVRIVLGLIALYGAAGLPVRAGIIKSTNPADVLPLDQLDPAARAVVSEVIRDCHFHRKSKPETFPANPKLYLSLLNDPVMTLALWHDLNPTPAQLHQVSPDLYQGADGSGTTATWQFVLRSPRLHVLVCRLNYETPRGNAKLESRIVMIVRTGYYREVDGETWVQHELEIFAKIDSRGWRTVAATARPLIEKLLEDQVQEAGWFVSLMARMVEMYPNWATAVAVSQAMVSPDRATAFRDLISQTRRPGALPGRPALAEAAATIAPGTETRTR